MIDKNLNSSWWALRAGLGTAAFLAGLDKYFDLLTNWSMYVSPLAERTLHVGGAALMHIVAPVEMAVGLMILTRWTRTGAYVASGWLLAIAINLLTAGAFFDVAVRDVIMAIGAFALANLTQARNAAATVQPSASRLRAEPMQPAAAA